MRAEERSGMSEGKLGHVKRSPINGRSGGNRTDELAIKEGKRTDEWGHVKRYIFFLILIHGY